MFIIILTLFISNSPVCDAMMIKCLVFILRCLGLFLLIHLGSARPATAQERPSCLASTLTSR